MYNPVYFVTSKLNDFLLILDVAVLLSLGGGKIRTNIETNRLILRDLQKQDTKHLAKRINSLNVTKYLAVVPHPYGMSDAKNFVNKVTKDQTTIPRENYELGITKKIGCLA